MEEPDNADIRLDGTVAVVTGAGRGIGRAVAVRLGRAGAAVAVLARSSDAVEETASLVRAAGGRALAVATDVTDERGIAGTLASVHDHLGVPDLLVNNAVSHVTVGPIWEVDPAAWWADVTTNLFGPFLCSRAVLPGMFGLGRGRIVNIASHATLRAYPYDTAYACSKIALIRFTDSLAAEVAEHGISVFALSPGSVQTEGTLAVLDSDLGRRWKAGVKDSLHWVDVAVPADAVAFLASGAGDGLTGRFFHVSDDVRALAARADQIVADDLFQMRWRTEP